MVFANFYQSSFYIKQTVLDISDLYLLKYHVLLNHTQNSHTWHSHDHTRQQNSTEACSNAFFEIQLQYTCCQNSSPCSCSRNRNTYKEYKRNPPPAVSCNFCPALLPFSIQNLKNYYFVPKWKDIFNIFVVLYLSQLHHQQTFKIWHSLINQIN